MNIYNILTNSASQFGAKPALIFKDQVISFADLKTKVFQLTHGLASLQVSKSTKIALFLPNGPEYVYSYLASFCLGATVVPLDFMLKTEELISCLEHSETEVLIALAKSEVDLRQLKRACLP